MRHSNAMLMLTALLAACPDIKLQEVGGKNDPFEYKPEPKRLPRVPPPTPPDVIESRQVRRARERYEAKCMAKGVRVAAATRDELDAPKP